MNKLFIILTVLLVGCVTEIPPMQASEEWICQYGQDLDGDGDIDQEDFYLYLKGEKGDPGENGLSAYDLWVIDVSHGLIDPKTGEEWPKEATSKMYYYDYLRGASGINGINGISAFDIWKQMVDCGIFYYPHEEELTYIDMFIFLKGKDGKDGRDGKNGTIGQDGQKGEKGDNGVDGKDGIDGQTISISISDDGYWIIGGIKTDKKAIGVNGSKGDQGEKGDKGDKGDAGLTETEVFSALAQEFVDWRKVQGNQGNSVDDFLEWLAKQ